MDREPKLKPIQSVAERPHIAVQENFIEALKTVPSPDDLSDRDLRAIGEFLADALFDVNSKLEAYATEMESRGLGRPDVSEGDDDGCGA